MGNKFLGPNQGLTIREPTDASLAKGNIRNPPRFANLGMGGLNSASVSGVTKNEFAVKTPGATQRDMPSRQNADSKGDRG
jgi:hypothetical protein